MSYDPDKLTKQEKQVLGLIVGVSVGIVAVVLFFVS